MKTLNAGQQTEGEKITAIVIDDSPSFLDVFCHYLGAEGGTRIVGTAGNGFEAINLVLRMHPQLVVMDYHMPGLRGDKAADWITEHFPEIHVLLVSSDVHPEIVTTNSTKASAFLCKNDLMLNLKPLLESWFPHPGICDPRK